jgi:hypothetical protein
MICFGYPGQKYKNNTEITKNKGNSKENIAIITVF